MSKRAGLLILLFILIVAAGWRLWAKRDVLRLGGVNLQQLVNDSASSGDTSASAAGAQHDQSETSEGDDFDDKTGPPQAKARPEFGVAAADEIFPFQPDTPLLTRATEIPGKRPPLVYVAIGQTPDDQTTSASIWFAEFYKFQLRAQNGSKTLLNTVPNAYLLSSLERAFEDRPASATLEVFKADAEVQSADILALPLLDDSTSPSHLGLSLKLIDLRSSRTQNWSAREAGATSVQDAIVKSAVATMEFIGIDSASIEESGVKLGAPTDEAFALVQPVNPNKLTWEIAQAALRNDPDCRMLYGYDAGTTSRLQLLNAGLARFPDDTRYLLSKAFSLAENGSTTALVRFTSELMRRYPDNMYVYTRLPNRLRVIYVPSSPPGITPPEFAAMIQQMDNFVRLYPEVNSLAWDQAYLHKCLADYARGGRTIDRIPAEQLNVYSREGHNAYQIMTERVKKHPDHAALQRSYVYYMTAGNNATATQLLDHAKYVATLDPRATDVELEIAFRNSIGYGRPRDYFRIIDAALKNHQNDSDAIAEITKAVGQELSRQVGWGTMTEQNAYGTTNSYLSRFVSGAEFAYKHGKSLGITYDQMYYHIAEVTGRQDLLEKWGETGQNSYAALREAKAAMDRGDWNTSLRMANLALPVTERGTEKAHLCRYWIVKSLWKLKRYDESLKAAREGIFAFPYKQTFYYMYAIVGLEYGEDLETAFDCAWRAIDLGTDNKGCNETFEKLREKLSKPPHPALANSRNQ